MANKSRGKMGHFTLTEQLLRELFEAGDSPERVLRLLNLSSREIRLAVLTHKFPEEQQEELRNLLAMAERLELSTSDSKGVGPKVMVVMQDILTAFRRGTGSGSVVVDPEAEEFFLARYLPWIEEAKPEVAHSPLEIWSEQASAFLGNFYRIGKRAAFYAHGDTIRRSEISTAMLEVENSADCTYCPASA